MKEVEIKFVDYLTVKKSYAVQFGVRRVYVYLPKSQCKIDELAETITIPKWLWLKMRDQINTARR